MFEEDCEKDDAICSIRVQKDETLKFITFLDSTIGKQSAADAIRLSLLDDDRTLHNLCVTINIYKTNPKNENSQQGVIIAEKGENDAVGRKALKKRPHRRKISSPVKNTAETPGEVNELAEPVSEPPNSSTSGKRAKKRKNSKKHVAVIKNLDSSTITDTQTLGDTTGDQLQQQQRSAFSDNRLNEPNDDDDRLHTPRPPNYDFNDAANRTPVNEHPHHDANYNDQAFSSREPDQQGQQINLGFDEQTVNNSNSDNVSTPNLDNCNCSICQDNKTLPLSLRRDYHRCKVDGCNSVYRSSSHAFSAHALHMFLSHQGPKPYPCTYNGCDKSFARMHDFDRHMRIHTGEKPFVCRTCDRRFRDQSHLRRHNLTHGGEKLECPICKRKLADPNSVRNHAKTHSTNYVPVKRPNRRKTTKKPKNPDFSTPNNAFAQTVTLGDNTTGAQQQQQTKSAQQQQKISQNRFYPENPVSLPLNSAFTDTRAFAGYTMGAQQQQQLPFYDNRPKEPNHHDFRDAANWTSVNENPYVANYKGQQPFSSTTSREQHQHQQQINLGLAQNTVNYHFENPAAPKVSKNSIFPKTHDSLPYNAFTQPRMYGDTMGAQPQHQHLPFCDNRLNALPSQNDDRMNQQQQIDYDFHDANRIPVNENPHSARYNIRTRSSRERHQHQLSNPGFVEKPASSRFENVSAPKTSKKRVSSKNPDSLPLNAFTHQTRPTVGDTMTGAQKQQLPVSDNRLNAPPPNSSGNQLNQQQLPDYDFHDANRIPVNENPNNANFKGQSTSREQQQKNSGVVENSATSNSDNASAPNLDDCDCSVCQQNKKLPPSLRRDLHRCSIDGCNRVYKTSNREQHMFFCHSANKPYACTHEGCGKAFLRRCDLVGHVRTHTGEKPYQCYVCDKSFTTRSELSRHSRKHTLEENYECPECKLKFRTADQCYKHGVKVHSLE